VLCLFNILGTPTNTAIHRYVNQKKVPHLFPASGASKWADPANFPWTMGFQLSYRTEGAIYAQTLAGTKDLRIGILMQNDEYGRDYVEGFRRGLGPAADRSIVKHVTYEVTDPAIDSQILQLKNAGVDVWLNISTPKFAAMAIRMAAEIKWSPVHFLNNVSASVASVMQPAGLDAGREIITAAYLMDPTDSAWTSNADMAKWRQWMRKYNSATPLDNSNALYAYCVAFLMEQTLRKCGDNLTRENVMRQAANHQRLRVPGLLPGITVSTSRTDYFPIESGNLMRFNGRGWELFGELISAESS
jgi:branched-chain amino acid transport system substrate-binding protein